MFSDLDDAKINDGIMNETFGLRFGTAGSGIYVFYEPTDLSHTSYRIAKYFENISGLPSSTAFSFNSNPVDVDEKTVVTNSASVVKTNTNIAKNGMGRTVWFANFNYQSTDQGINETKQLMKTVVLWASGERFNMDVIDKTLPKTYVIARYISADEFGQYEIAITLWKIFQ